ncbi:hypothetical protein [Priestia koreensis]|uniref:DUF1641 domain-containing protein n=1 Tax=Priestia koreensis TaxID=284581 RepID=UPI0028F72765|nr:hypothetical protein [Priestia koreensis]
MAKAIRSIKKQVPDKHQEQADALADIVTALADNRDAIMTTMDILKNLHEMGALHAISAALQKRNDIGYIAVQQIDQPGMHNIIKNAMNTMKFLGSVNADELQKLLNGVSNGFTYMNESIEKNEERSLWQLSKTMRTPEAKAAIGSMTAFMQGLGEGFLDKKHSDH